METIYGDGLAGIGHRVTNFVGFKLASGCSEFFRG